MEHFETAIAKHVMTPAEYLKLANMLDFAKRWAKLGPRVAEQVEELVEYANTLATCELYGKPRPKRPNVDRDAIEEARQALAGASSDLEVNFGTIGTLTSDLDQILRRA